MTDTPTDRETVESLAQLADAWGEMKLAAGQEYASDDRARFADTLRALLDERDALHAEVERLREAWPITGTNAERDVLAERKRQIEAEGYTGGDDDRWRRGEIARAAATYCLTAWPRDAGDMAFAGQLWPWVRATLRPKHRRRDLVRAAALIIAEIERLDRAALKDGGE